MYSQSYDVYLCDIFISYMDNYIFMQFDDYRDKRRNLKPIYTPARMSVRNIESNAVNSDICRLRIETNSLDVCHVYVFIKRY